MVLTAWSQPCDWRLATTQGPSDLVPLASAKALRASLNADILGTSRASKMRWLDPCAISRALGAKAMIRH